MVQGDIFPTLLHRYADLLAIPLTNIYNEISTTMVWPLCWKREFVTIIPKCRNPSSLGDLRNISCTMLPSKIYESYVLKWLSTEVSCKPNQYGGIKGCSVSHLLIDLWDEIMNNLEDARAATMITAIDYAKAFNRLSFQHCLSAFARKGASSQTISLLATFLSNRSMSVRVSDTWSVPRPVFGGVPQGSILGVLLFNIATDDLEDDTEDHRVFVNDEERVCPRPPPTRSALSPLAEPFVPATHLPGPMPDDLEPSAGKISPEWMLMNGAQCTSPLAGPPPSACNMEDLRNCSTCLSLSAQDDTTISPPMATAESRRFVGDQADPVEDSLGESSLSGSSLDSLSG